MSMRHTMLWATLTGTTRLVSFMPHALSPYQTNTIFVLLFISVLNSLKVELLSSLELYHLSLYPPCIKALSEPRSNHFCAEVLLLIQDFESAITKAVCGRNCPFILTFNVQTEFKPKLNTF